MSYYGDGRVTSDFCGLARRQRQAEEPDCTQIYFSGCGADIGAGKYNDGTPAARQRLTARVREAMAAAAAATRPEPLRTAEWRSCGVRLDPNPALREEALRLAVSGEDGESEPPASAYQRLHRRMISAFQLGWLDRCRRQSPIVLSALHLNHVSMLHLPGEMFVEYQLRAQRMAPDRFVVAAAYGDDGPFYIPPRAEYALGGYEVSMAFAAETADAILTEGIRQLVR